MTVKHPKLLTNGEGMVEKRLEFLFGLGLSDDAVKKIVRSHPQARGRMRVPPPRNTTLNTASPAQAHVLLALAWSPPAGPRSSRPFASQPPPPPPGAQLQPGEHEAPR